MMFFRSLTLLLVAVGFCAALGTDLSKWRQDGYYGKQALKDGQAIPADNPEVRPFNISFPDADLAYLKERLAKDRFIDHLPGTAFRYGMNSDELKKVVSYWNSTYDWRKQEAYLNSLPQFKTQIEGIDIHFVHVKASPKAKTVIPLVTVHGWPSSFMEAYKGIPMLTEPDANGVAYDVIAPSIPGFGYSEAAHQTRLDYTAVARIFTKLYKRLGYEKAMLQGGDWGMAITQAMAVLYPETTIGIHVLGAFDAVEKLLSIDRVLRYVMSPNILGKLTSVLNGGNITAIFPGLKEKLTEAFEETGVLHDMGTKPDTLTSALFDTPVGMAAHILEKYSTFVNTANRNLDDGGLTQKFTMDELLNVVMIYWTSGNIAGTARLYKELVQVNSGVMNEKILPPAGVVDSDHELVHSTRADTEPNYAKLLQFSVLTDVGHFMFFEEPKKIVDDLRSLTQKILTPSSGGIGGVIGGIIGNLG